MQLAYFKKSQTVKLESDVILDYYLKEIRPLAEHGVVIWNSGLTKGQINDLEKIQKVAFRIIIDDSYTSYEVACTLLNVSPLQNTNFTCRGRHIVFFNYQILLGPPC